MSKCIDCRNKDEKHDLCKKDRHQSFYGDGRCVDFERGKIDLITKDILSNLYQMLTELIGPGNVWLKQKLEETIELVKTAEHCSCQQREIDRLEAEKEELNSTIMFATRENQKLQAELLRKSELLTRHRICARCGKQLSPAEAKSVHTCYDEQALKDNENTKTKTAK